MFDRRVHTDTAVEEERTAEEQDSRCTAAPVGILQPLGCGGSLGQGSMTF